MTDTQRLLCVLLAEDNRTNQLVAQVMLKKLNCIAEIANNGREAVDMTGASAYNLVLMDVQMPEMDGITATRAIRSRERSSGKRLPIIAMTADSSEEGMAKCREAGMDDAVDKPLVKEKLEKILAKWGNPASAA